MVDETCGPLTLRSEPGVRCEGYGQTVWAWPVAADRYRVYSLRVEVADELDGDVVRQVEEAVAADD
jgi:hypothetical protein